MFDFYHKNCIKPPPPIIPSKISLRVWEYDCGTPSFDPECLEIMTIFKINGREFDATYANLPQWKKVPIIEIDGLEYTDCEFVINRTFNLLSKGVDLCLNQEQSLFLPQYKKYFKDNFVYPFLFDCWSNDVNYKLVIEPWYLTVIPFPFNFFYVKRRREQLNRVLATKNASHPFKVFMDIQRYNVCNCLKNFSKMLDDDRIYFFGSLPTTLDALIYSYLKVALNLPLPDNRLQCSIKRHSNLLNFVDRMTDQYFPEITHELKYVDPVHEQVELVSVKTLIMAGLCVSVAMILFVFTRGTFK